MYRDLFLARNASSSLFVGNTNIPDNRLFRDETNKNLEFTYQTELLWKITTGSVEHKIFAGLEYQYKNYSFIRDTLVFSPINNVFNPVLEQSRNQRNSFIRDYDVNLLANYYGVYLQDEIKLSDQFKARIGGRFDSFGANRNGYVNAANRNNTIVLNTFTGDLNATPTRFSYQAGLVYQPVYEVSLYGGVSSSNLPFLSTQGVPNNVIDPPEEGLQYELGVKTELFGGKLNANLAWFDTTRKNFVVVVDTIRQPVGAQKTQGIELELNAEPIKGWKIYTGYVLYDARFTNLPDNPSLEGNIPVGVPRNAASLWTSYEIQSGLLKGLGVGGGLTFRDSSFQDQQNNKVIPGYTTLDLALFYRRDDFEAQLNFVNITDEKYFRNGVNSGVLPGEPFSVQASVKYKF